MGKLHREMQRRRVGSRQNEQLGGKGMGPEELSFEVLCVLTWVLLYGWVIVPALSKFSISSGGGCGEPSQLQRMGAGRVLMAISMAIAAVVETSRLASTDRTWA